MRAHTHTHTHTHTQTHTHSYTHTQNSRLDGKSVVIYNKAMKPMGCATIFRATSSPKKMAVAKYVKNE